MRVDFCSKENILWKIQTNQFYYSQLTKIDLYNIQIKKEKDLIEYIFNQEIKINENIKNDFHCYLDNTQTEVDKLVEKEEKIN